MESKLGLVQPQATDLAADELAAVERLQKGYHDLKTELAQGDRRAGGSDRGAADRLVLPRPCAAGGRAGAGQDAADLARCPRRWG